VLSWKLEEATNKIAVLNITISYQITKI